MNTYQTVLTQSFNSGKSLQESQRLAVAAEKYEEAVEHYIAMGLSRSDAQGVVDATLTNLKGE